MRRYNMRTSYMTAYDTLRSQRQKTEESIETENKEKDWLRNVQSISLSISLILAGIVLLILASIL